MSCTTRNLMGYLILYESHNETLVCHGGARPPMKIKPKIIVFLDSNHEWRCWIKECFCFWFCTATPIVHWHLELETSATHSTNLMTHYRRACRVFWRICVCHKDILGNTIALKWQKLSQLCFIRQLILRSTGSRRRSLESKMGRH